MPGSILIGVCYVLLAVFIVGFLIRTLRIAKLPVHLRWELAPVPHEKGKGHYGGSYFEEFEWWTQPREKSLVQEFTYMFQEIVFLKGVREHNRRLWRFSFPFHFGMYVLIAAAPLLALGTVLNSIGAPAGAGVTSMVQVSAGAGFLLAGVGALGLLVKRLVDPRLRPFTSPASLLNLVLLLAVFASGMYALVATDRFATEVAAFAVALLTVAPAVEPSATTAVHFTLALVFLAYLPFTQMMHFVAKYFTYHQVRWDDAPLEAGGRLERKVAAQLQQPVTWSGPHVKADGKKNWVDIATEETGT